MFEIRRDAYRTNRMVLKFFSLAALGGFLIWDENRQAEPFWFWYAMGVFFLIWAALGFRNVGRPVLLRADVSGIFAHTAWGTHRFDWAALKWVDFRRPHGAAVLCYRKASGKDGFVILTRRATSDAERAEALQAILAHRPDVPTANPEPFIEFRKRSA